MQPNPFLLCFNLFSTIIIIIILVLHILFAVAIYKDANRIDHSPHQPLMFVDSSAWCITILIFGLIGVLTYWLIHHSNLSNKISPENYKQLK